MNDYIPGNVVKVEEPKKPTRWEKIKQGLGSIKDAVGNAIGNAKFGGN